MGTSLFRSWARKAWFIRAACQIALAAKPAPTCRAAWLYSSRADPSFASVTPTQLTTGSYPHSAHKARRRSPGSGAPHSATYAAPVW